MPKASENFAQKCKRLFEQADSDGKPGLSVSELRVLVRELCKAEVADCVVADIFRDLDDDGDKVLSWDEFKEVYDKKDPKSVQENELRELFDKLDTDHSGSLSKDEIRKAFQDLEIKCPDENLDNADENDDGKVSCEEFIANWKQFQ